MQMSFPVRTAVSGSARRRASLALRGAALGGLLMALPGCQSIDVNASNAAQIRMIAASPDAPGLDFEVGSSVVAYNVGFGDATSYVTESPANYKVSIVNHNTNGVLATQTQTLSAQKTYTALAGNVAASLQETILQDQNSPAPSGEIAVRVLDQALHVGAVDVYLVPSTGKLTTTAPILTNLSFGSNSGYINIPSGTYAIAVVPTGTVPVSTTVTLLTGPSVGYAVGAVRTVVLIDQLVTTTPGVGAIVAVDYDSPGASQ
jgi:hypothetical protein